MSECRIFACVLLPQSLLFSLPVRPRPISPLFPYTTLFRSLAGRDRALRHLARLRALGGAGAGPLRRLRDHRGRAAQEGRPQDRKSTRLNSSHLVISYAVFCLKKKKQLTHTNFVNQHTQLLI